MDNVLMVLMVPEPRSSVTSLEHGTEKVQIT